MGMEFFGLGSITQLGPLLLRQQASPSRCPMLVCRGLGMLAIHPPAQAAHHHGSVALSLRKRRARLNAFSHSLFHFTENILFSLQKS